MMVSVLAATLMVFDTPAAYHSRYVEADSNTAVRSQYWNGLDPGAWGLQVRSSTGGFEGLFTRLDPLAGLAVLSAREAVSNHGGRVIEPEHLLLGILAASPDVMAQIAGSGWSLESVERELKTKLPTGERISEEAEAQFSARSIRVLSSANDTAAAVKSAHIQIEHLLLGLLSDPGAVGQVLERAGIDRTKVLASLKTKGF